MVQDLRQLDQQIRSLIDEELDRRYLTATILQVDAVRNEYDTSY